MARPGRALDVLARHCLSDRESVDTLKQLFAKTRSWPVQGDRGRAPARGPQVGASPEMLRTLRENRVKASPGDNMVDALIQRLQNLPEPGLACGACGAAGVAEPCRCGILAALRPVQQSAHAHPNSISRTLALFGASLALAIPLAAAAAPKTVCTITVNSPDERESFDAIFLRGLSLRRTGGARPARLACFRVRAARAVRRPDHLRPLRRRHEFYTDRLDRADTSPWRRWSGPPA